MDKFEMSGHTRARPILETKNYTNKSALIFK